MHIYYVKHRKYYLFNGDHNKQKKKKPIVERKTAYQLKFARDIYCILKKNIQKGLPISKFRISFTYTPFFKQ